MAAVHEEAAGPHGRQARERALHPVLLGDLLGDDGGGEALAHRVGDERPDPHLVDAAPEIDVDDPGPGLEDARLGLEGGCGRLGGVEHLHDEIGCGTGPHLVAGEPQQLRGVVGGQAFEHPRG